MSLKVRILQQKENNFLVERYFKDDQTTDYVVCQNYDIETNTYEKGIISKKLQDALTDFNYLVNEPNFYMKMFRYYDEREKKKYDKKTSDLTLNATS